MKKTQEYFDAVHEAVKTLYIYESNNDKCDDEAYDKKIDELAASVQKQFPEVKDIDDIVRDILDGYLWA